ncbi:MAG TPA: DUF4184 family protein [Steroidobacteraceae bacterium]|nr:DUF4184 family protein [Steroidobacteraceae bacterium]
MPFTVSHAAAVLPLHRLGNHSLPLTALMVGSMAPDFGYFFSHEASRALTHSFTGLFIFALPAGLCVWLFYVAFLEKATITLLSDRWHTRFAHTDAITLALIGRASIAIILGAATHLVWDAFTHRGTLVTDAIPALLGATPGFGWLPIYHLLHFLSSVAGLVILAIWARNLHRLPAKSLIRPYKIRERARVGALWLLLFASMAGGILDWLPYAHSRYDAQLFSAAVGSMSGFFIAWCCIAVGLWIKARRAGRQRRV